MESSSPKHLNVSSHSFVPSIPNFNEQQNFQPGNSVQKTRNIAHECLMKRVFESLKKNKDTTAESKTELNPKQQVELKSPAQIQSTVRQKMEISSQTSSSKNRSNCFSTLFF
jgi:hypothetical protein